MITGETGTGKELIARLIHSSSPRKDKPFLPVHCAALPANLLESELFGYEKGAFTGRYPAQNRTLRGGGRRHNLPRRNRGNRRADAGQAFALFGDKDFRKARRTQSITVDVRVVCATNKDLKAMSERGEYREDLYYRLNVVEIKIPPLREHREDIEPLLKSYIGYYARENGVEPVEISPEALDILEKYEWRATSGTQKFRRKHRGNEPNPQPRSKRPRPKILASAPPRKPDALEKRERGGAYQKGVGGFGRKQKQGGGNARNQPPHAPQKARRIQTRIAWARI